MARIHLLAVVVILLAACDQDRIEITISPRPDGSFDREICFWRSPVAAGDVSAPTETLLEAPRRIYERPAESPRMPAPAVTFRGTFRAVPGDLSDEGKINAGGMTVWSSPIGRVTYYRERFPGRKDFHRAMLEISEVIDLLFEFGAALTEEVLGGEPGVEKLQAELRGPVRDDVKNIATLVAATWLAESADLRPRSDAASGEISSRLYWLLAYVLQYLEERGDVDLRTLPRDISDVERGREVALERVARAMGRKLDAGLRAKLAIFEDEEKLDELFERAAKRCGIDLEKEKERGKRVFLSLLPISFLEPRVTLRVRMPVPPVETNGLWLAAEREVRFATELNASRPLAPLAYAMWAVPDREWQKRRLGRVAVEGERLRDLVVWEVSLSPGDSRSWKEAIEGLDAEGDLAAQIRSIRLGGAEDLPQGAGLLLEALGLATEDE